MLPALTCLLGKPAQGADDLGAKLKGYAAEHLSKALSIAADYRSADAQDQDENTLVLYLTEVNWAVYLALTAYRTDMKEIPGDLHDLVSSGYLSEWPANPFDEWNPTEVLGPGAGFKPGCLVWSVCPPAYYSRQWVNGGFVNKPLSYQLSILGPAEDHPYSAKIDPMEGNVWFAAPRGILMTLGAFRESAAQSEEKARKRAEQQAAPQGGKDA